jgi:hypothetical protein
MLYRWMFNLARWFALEAHRHASSVADEYIADAYICAETANVPQPTLHGNDRCRDPLQSLGHPQLGPAPLQRAQRATRRVANRRVAPFRRSDRRRERRGT